MVFFLYFFLGITRGYFRKRIWCYKTNTDCTKDIRRLYGGRFETIS